MEIAKKNEFVELKFTGIANGEVFDSNIEEDLKKVNSQSPAEKTIVCIGQGMIIPGLDKALEGKEIGKEYGASIKAPEAFGVRKR
ncbi:MAG: FKBP-type peptidyl-prolyl cis-trans isomerase, partial [archaeon]